jgi:PHP family Zn ribbon phosphoesterase
MHGVITLRLEYTLYRCTENHSYFSEFVGGEKKNVILAKISFNNLLLVLPLKSVLKSECNYGVQYGHARSNYTQT